MSTRVFRCSGAGGLTTTIHVHRVPHSAAKASVTTCVKRSDFHDVVGEKPQETKKIPHKLLNSDDVRVCFENELPS